MEYLTTLDVIAAKAESVIGTAEPLASDDCNVRVWEPSLSALDVPMDADPSKVATGDPFLSEAIPGPQTASISFHTKLVNKTAGAEPNWTKFIKTAGCMVSGYNAALGSGYIMYPHKRCMESGLSVGLYMCSPTAGELLQIAGAMSNCVISTEGAGKPYKMQWEYQGSLADVNDVAEDDIPVPTSMDTEIPDTFKAGYAVISGVANFSGCVSAMTFDFGNQIGPVECQSSATGYSKYIIKDMQPLLTINPSLPAISSYDWFDKFTTGSVQGFYISTDQFCLAIPRGQITSCTPEDADGIKRLNITVRPLRATTAETTAGYASWYLIVK